MGGVYNNFIIITVTWSEVPDHVKLTGMDHQIKRDDDKSIIYPSYVIEKLWKEYFGSTFQRLFTKEKHILKELSLIFLGKKLDAFSTVSEIVSWKSF